MDFFELLPPSEAMVGFKALHQTLQLNSDDYYNTGLNIILAYRLSHMSQTVSGMAGQGQILAKSLYPPSILNLVSSNRKSFKICGDDCCFGKRSPIQCDAADPNYFNPANFEIVGDTAILEIQPGLVSLGNNNNLANSDHSTRHEVIYVHGYGFQLRMNNNEWVGKDSNAIVTTPSSELPLDAIV